MTYPTDEMLLDNIAKEMPSFKGMYIHYVILDTVNDETGNKYIITYNNGTITIQKRGEQND